MKGKLLLSPLFLFSALAGTAQEASSTYAITGRGVGDFSWVNIRQVNIQTGQLERTIYENAGNTAMTNALSAGTNNITPIPAMGYGVAAAAYDKAHNRLYYTQMHFGELSYVDLGKKEPSFNFSGALVSRMPGTLLTEESHITRMVIGADGYGYAISNDANHLIRFTTGKKAVITDLGNLVDAESNKGISIHNKCTSWGGDMIADAFNKLYIITANHYVFSVDVDSRVATLMGTITGLPAQYSTNGAAVDNDGNIVVSSANTFEGYYKFKLSDLAAVRIEGSDKTYNASDLANGNFLFQKEADARNKFNVNPALPPVEFVSTDSKVFPNPVTGNEFKVLLDGQKPGAYTIIVTDLSGKNILNRSVNYSGKAQVETVKVDRLLGKGMYFVKVTGAGNEVIFTEKIMVQ
ncbi:MAG: T9SS type A sorting domain-containing protein [Chitinophagaceae bacterium]|nr:T9SS type A sorting domain-containing protein [Chitinophagaceae bacterium]